MKVLAEVSNSVADVWNNFPGFGMQTLDQGKSYLWEKKAVKKFKGVESVNDKFLFGTVDRSWNL